MRWLISLIAVSALAQSPVQRATARLAEQAEQFYKVAPRIAGRETLEHRTPPQNEPADKQLKTRDGKPADQPTSLSNPDWKTVKVVSEYGFGLMSGDLVELRRVVSVNGNTIRNKLDSLATAISSSGDKRKRELLRVFEKIGIEGAATDFGQLLLLFHPNSIQSFEMLYAGQQMLGNQRAAVFNYRQIEGDPMMTVMPSGKIFLEPETFRLLTISMNATAGEGGSSVRIEARVDYRPSGFGIVLPERVQHRELNGIYVIVTNEFTYSDYQFLSPAKSQ
jgi:hypothetical protein